MKDAKAMVYVEYVKATVAKGLVSEKKQVVIELIVIVKLKLSYVEGFIVESFVIKRQGLNNPEYTPDVSFN